MVITTQHILPNENKVTTIPRLYLYVLEFQGDVIIELQRHVHLADELCRVSIRVDVRSRVGANG